MADQGSEGLLSPYLRRRRIAAAKPYLQGRVLDVGCGSGDLAGYVQATQYLGIDTDSESISIARTNHPGYQFESSMPSESGGFDTVVGLAVIEHIANPSGFIRLLRDQLCNAPGSRIVLTTPNPVMDRIHGLGARIGLFSLHANQEHQKLLDRSAMEKLAHASDCHVIKYRRFLCAANQLFILAAKE